MLSASFLFWSPLCASLWRAFVFSSSQPWFSELHSYFLCRTTLWCVIFFFWFADFYADKIKIRICRIWKSTIPGTVQKYTNLHCILVDEEQHAIEASTLDVDYDVMASKIEAGGCYEITEFQTVKIRGQYRVVLFTSKTTFRKLASVFPPISRHQFFLQDYNTLCPRLNRVDILTDVIGPISVVRQLEPKQINQRVVYKCDVVIQNIRKEELTVTLWADVAKAFSFLSAEEFSLPVIVVFTSLKVKIYLEKIYLSSTGSSLFFIDPNIPEVNTYKSVFCNWKETLEMLSPFAIQGNEAQILYTAKKVTTDELAFLDPDLHKNDTFVCKASVKHFDTRFNWWYSACPNCVKQMHKDPTTGQLICQKHPNQIPTPYKVNLIFEDETNEMNSLIIGKCGEKLFGMPYKDLKKIFHLRFGNRRNTFNSNDILIHNVTEDTAMHPATPQPLSREITMSSPTVSSSTSTVEPNEQSFKRKRESIRRALFTGVEQSGVEEISDTDPRVG
ncbi:hypothetical protein DVH24_021932 [Malus domestica]|uniref:Replication factor A C-terminal domain-containing protein n=1 Tax=Malus domestica TaxID=3750 RepID=A0A498ITQ3_MALDO|nr:hypothetical protein DVH24_021932 [Malus domestica]